jgi:hypothetical protein
MNKVVDLIGELSAGVSFAGEISVPPGHGPATRIRATLDAKWPTELLGPSPHAQANARIPARARPALSLHSP